MICLCLTEETVKANLSIVNDYNDIVGLFELRYDFLKKGESFGTIIANCDKEVIFTIRAPQDGGKRDINNQEFLTAYKQAIDHKVGYIDLHYFPNEESLADKAFLDELANYARANNVKVIRSIHFMNSFPSNLEQIFSKLTILDADVFKLAVKPETTAQLHDLIRFAADHKELPHVILGMGDYGFPTRILTRRLGSLWTYCSPLQSEKAAPGQVTPELLIDTYKYHEIKKDDELACVIGNPVMHSKSPDIHNTALRKAGISCLYLPVMVDVVNDFVELAKTLNIKAVSVTVPHKETVIPFCTGVSSEVEFTGACNTLVGKPGNWQGYNTDIEGFLIPFQRFIKPIELKGLRVLIIGAGGAASGIAYGLKMAGVELLIANRTYSKAQKLADELGMHSVELKSENYSRMKDFSSIIVQTTNCGMHPFEDLNPLEGYPFDGNEMVYDIVYVPPETKLMKAARKAGCKTVNGNEMLLEQAKVQFSLFNGVEYH